MIRTACGCTTHGPGPACPEGRALYAAMLQAFEHLFQEKAMIAQDERWSIAALSRLVYIDHLNGWQEGDVKIQRRAGWEMVFTRLGGQWIFQFGTKEDALLVDWLATRGYQHVVRVNSARPGDHLLGYYRTTEKSDQGVSPGVQRPARGDREGGVG